MREVRRARLARLVHELDDALLLGLARRHTEDSVHRLGLPLLLLLGGHLVEARARHALNDGLVVRVHWRVDDARVRAAAGHVDGALAVGFLRGWHEPERERSSRSDRGDVS